VAGYETTSGITTSVLYGTPTLGQGRFGGGSTTTAGDGCTQGLQYSFLFNFFRSKYFN
jgi:hypothetical protein